MGAKPHPNREAVLKDYAETDLPIKDLAKKHGVSYSSITLWASQRGLARKSKSTGELTNGEWVSNANGVKYWVPNA